MSTKFFTVRTLGLAIASALLVASSVFADAPLSYNFAQIKLRPLVAESVTREPVPDDVQKDFNQRLRENSALLRQKDFAKGIPAFETMLKDFAPFPKLLKETRETYARNLANREEYYDKALKIYDDLLTMQNLPSVRITAYLGCKQRILEKQEKYLEANKVLLRMLEQPEIEPGRRDELKLQIIRNIIRMKDYQTAINVALPLVKSPSLTPKARVDIALAAGDCLDSYLEKPDLAYDLYQSIKDIPLGKKEEWTKLERAHRLSNAYLRNKTHGPQYEKSINALRAVYNDETLSFEPRLHAARALISLRNQLRKDPDPLAVVKETKDFADKNKSQMKPEQYFSLLQNCMKVFAKRKIDSPEGKKLAASIYEDQTAPADIRIKALYFITGDPISTKDKAKDEKIYREAIPIAKDSPQMLADLLEHIAKLYLRDNDQDKMLAIYREAPKYNKSPETTKFVAIKIAEVYKQFLQYEKAVSFLLENGLKRQAADLADSWDYKDPELAKKLYMEILTDEKASREDRVNAYEHLFDGGELAKKYFEFYAMKDRSSKTKAMYFLSAKIYVPMKGFAYYGDYDKVATTYELYTRVMKDSKDLRHHQVYFYGALAYLYKGDLAKAARICKEAAADKLLRATPIQRYTLNMIGDLATRKGSVKQLEAACKEADKRFAGDIPAKDRNDQLDILGAAMSLARLENHVRAVSAYKDSLIVPFPQKSYTIEYSPVPLISVDDWNRLAKKPSEEILDRPFGGSMDFLETDVATGDRGAVVGKGKAKDGNDQKPSFSMICDMNGLHIRYRYPTANAHEIEIGKKSGGLYEGYIAPGENQPYICLLQTAGQSGRLEPYNTAYTSANHVRVYENDPKYLRTQTLFTDDAVISYIFLDWEAYATVIPENGSVWEYENIFWGPNGGETWNGTTSVHGRGTWGRLVFNLPKKARADILRKLLFKVKPQFDAEHWTGSASEGVIDYWKDDEIGDPAFYEECLKPLVEKLDGYRTTLMEKELNDDEIIALAEKALPAWQNFRYTVERLRREYLDKQLMQVK